MFKRGAVACLCVVLMLCLAGPAVGAIKNVGFNDFYSQVGVEFPGASGEMTVGQTYTGVVANPEKLKALGFTDVHKGDKVKVQVIDRGKSTLLLMSTGQEKTITLK